ncbi:MAG: hypothetical protein ACYTGH_16200 [Planctomycetota bacterium]|jgi:hypothetical protein
MNESILESAWNAAVRDDRVDFGRLDEELQRGVIERLAADPSAGAALGPVSLTASALTADRLAANRSAVESAYSLGGYGRRLQNLYRAVIQSSSGPVEYLDGHALLDAFLDPARFMLLRT